MKFKTYTAGLFALGFLAGMPLRSTADLIEPPESYGRIARIVANGLPRVHLSHLEFGDDVAGKALETYLSSLDFDHSIFLAEDVEDFKLTASKLDDDLKEGHLEFAYQVFEVFKRRTADRIAYANSLLDAGFDLARTETYDRDRDKAPWPADKKAADELWRKKIKNEYVSRLVNKAVAEQEAKMAVAAGEAKEDDGDAAAKVLKEETAEDVIRKRYSQFTNVLDGYDAEWVLQVYLNAFTRAYDAHSSYLSPRATEDFDISMKLSLHGIGALLTVEDGAAKIVRLIKGGPAARDKRLQAGDKIIAVAQDGEEEVDILYQPLYKSVRLIRGEIGTRVVLSIIPASDLSGTKVKKIDLIRDEIKLEERAAKAETRDVPQTVGKETPFKIGVITLPDFYADMGARRSGDSEMRSSSRDVRKLLEDMGTQNVDGIILDLRDNGGGSLPDAVEMAGFFIPDGPIVQVKANRAVQSLNDPDPKTVYDGPLVILVNRQSASASEIVAAAMQDYGRAVIVGDTKTHGKGSVQTMFPLDRRNSDMGSLKLTTAGFYRINGGSTQIKGVTPDIIIPSALDVMEIGEEFLPNVLPWSVVESADFTKTDNLVGLLPELRKRSSNRQSSSERFQTYGNLVVRLKERVAQTELPLNYEERLVMALRDKELEDMQEKALGLADEDPEIPDGEEAKKADDLILDEAFCITRDLIEMSSQVTLGATP